VRFPDITTFSRKTSESHGQDDDDTSGVAVEDCCKSAVLVVFSTILHGG